MRKTIFITLALATALVLHAQNNISEVLRVIEQNNTTLKALRETANAQKLGNRTDIYLSDPEVGFNCLWGNNTSPRARQDFNISQSIDLPTVLGMRSKVANHSNELVEWQYRADRMNLMLEAKKYCLDLIYFNLMLGELDVRLEHARAIADAQKKRMDTGEGNILEYNNSQLNLSTVKGEMARVRTERDGVVAQLKRLNGGAELAAELASFPAIQMPADFARWYSVAEEKNPVLAYVRQEIVLSKQQLSLNKAQGLPSFRVGYMSENVFGEGFQGLTLGMSLPLWSNKNKVKQAKNMVHAAENRQADAKQQFYSQLEILYKRVAGLKATADNYRTSLSKANNSTLLKKALDEGEISLVEYITEIGLYYNAVDQALQAELDYQKAYAELSAFEL